jgi:hypothetical protein
VDNRLFKIVRVDSSKFDIRGWWMIIDKKYSYDDDNIHKNNPIEHLNKGKVLFSDDYFYAFTPDLHNLIFNPTFKKKYYENVKKNSRLTYLQNFFEGLLYVNIYENNESEPLSTVTVINQDLIAYTEADDEFVFMERINNNSDNNFWQKVDDFEVMISNGYSGYNYQYIVLPKEKVKKNEGFLEFIYISQKTCVDTTFSIKYIINKNIHSQLKKDYNLYTIQKKGVLNDYIELSKIQSNVLKIEHGNCKSKNEWEFMWRFVDKIKPKRVILKKVVLNSHPDTPTKSYLIKGDEVEVLEEKGEWLRVRYYGKKIIEGWIKKSDVE